MKIICYEKDIPFIMLSCVIVFIARGTRYLKKVGDRAKISAENNVNNKVNNTVDKTVDDAMNPNLKVREIRVAQIL